MKRLQLPQKHTCTTNTSQCLTRGLLQPPQTLYPENVSTPPYTPNSCSVSTAYTHSKCTNQSNNLINVCTHTHTHTHSGLPVMEQVRLRESPSRRMPGGGMILTVGATGERGGRNGYRGNQSRVTVGGSVIITTLRVKQLLLC